MNSQVEAQPLHRRLGLTDDELDRIEAILGRSPNHAELAMYSVMWSEHCSYKSSRIHLKTLPSEGPLVLVGPGEGAGVIEVDGFGVAIRIESHNHPSFVEPVQGAATGIGGVVRDVLSMGARPIALLDSLRFGPLDEPYNRFLVEGVVSGISSYGNCIGVPTVGGEMVFDPSYSGNPLVNVMCVGVLPKDKIMAARAEGPGNAVLLLGSSTGRDGIGGVSVLASASFDEDSGSKRPSVQVGDPFTEKLLIEACLSLVEKGLVVGIQDLGGAGLCCATSEMAAAAGTGMKIELDKVNRREPGMAPFEMLTSESQERMLVVVDPADVDAALAECERMGLLASRIGEVTTSGRLEVFEAGNLAADVPAESLGDGPVYDRPSTKPAWIEGLAEKVEFPDVKSEELGRHLLQLLGSPSIASKRWAWEQYDHQVMLGTVVKPGHDAAVLRLPGSKIRIAVTTDGNGAYCFIDPNLGTQHSVAEAARNLSAVGAEPAGITNCMNFGNPELPDVMWQFIESVRGMGDACRAMAIPVTGGNVSFYNQTGTVSIHPTPVIGMLGIMPAGVQPPGAGFKSENDVIVVIGTTKAEAGGSSYLQEILGNLTGKLPELDLEAEMRAQALVRKAIEQNLVSSAHDCSSGGLAIALSECCILGGLGAEVTPEAGLTPTGWLFSESASRFVLSVQPDNLPALWELCEERGVPAAEVGSVKAGSVSIGDIPPVSLEDLTRAWDRGLADRIERPG